LANDASSKQLASIVSRIEKLEEDRAALGADIREIYAEAKGNGFNVKALRQVIRLRKMENHHREELESMVELYRGALGMK
jgi:uncharacterized protein (UPF0335 family)